jgi:hypothetical protein
MVPLLQNKEQKERSSLGHFRRRPLPPQSVVVVLLLFVLLNVVVGSLPTSNAEADCHCAPPS